MTSTRSHSSKHDSSFPSGVSGLTQSGGVIAAAGDINLWSTTTIAQSVGTIAAGGTIGATASNTLSQGNTGLTSATTVVAVLSGSGVRLHSLTADTAQGGDGMVDATRGAGADPLLYPVRIQAEVHGYSLGARADAKQQRYMNRGVTFGVGCALEALADSGLKITEENADMVGVMFGAGGGGTDLVVEYQHILEEKGPRRVTPFLVANFIPDAASGMAASLRAGVIHTHTDAMMILPADMPDLTATD